MAVDRPEPITRLVIAGTIIPGISASPPLIGDRWWDDFEWYFNFDRVRDIDERLVGGREHLCFGHQFATEAATPTAIPATAVDVLTGGHYIVQTRTKVVSGWAGGLSQTDAGRTTGSWRAASIRPRRV